MIRPIQLDCANHVTFRCGRIGSEVATMGPMGVREVPAVLDPPSEPWTSESGVRVIELPVEQHAEVIAGRYEILGLFSRGGEGIVFRARDRVLGETVALKVLHRALAQDADALARLREEVELAQRVIHPNVARTFDFGSHGKVAYLTMEAIEGESLSMRLACDFVLPLDEAVGVIRDIAAGIAAAHAVGVMHLDLKPDNIRFDKNGRVVITDFGIASAVDKLPCSRSGGIVGTPAYMAPEQLASPAMVDARADIYALGLVFYEMLTGQLPWTGSSELEVARARLIKAPRDPRELVPSLPDALADIVLDCLASSPEERLPSAELFLQCLEQCVEPPPAVFTTFDAAGS